MRFCGMNHNVAASPVIDIATTASQSSDVCHWNQPVDRDFVLKYEFVIIAMLPAMAPKRQEGRACTISH